MECIQSFRQIRFLDHYRFKELDIAGVGILMVDSVVIYQSQSFHGQILLFEVTVADFTKSSCNFYYRITDKLTGQAIAQAKTGVVFFDYELQKISPVPDVFKRTCAT